MTYCVWDVETTIKSSFKRKANPFDRSNYVVMSGWQRKGGAVRGEYFGRSPRPKDWFIKLLESTGLLIGVNIKFDLLYALFTDENHEENLKAWMAYVARGGNVWCCQLAEYLLEGMDPAAQMLSMDEMAPRYGGNLKYDEVKALWQAGVSTEDINPDLLRRYLCGEQATDGSQLDHGDIGNTEVIFLGQLERARAAGQVKSILMNMGSLLCTIEMERNGMAVDKALGLELAAKLEQELEQATIELSQYIPADLPFEFNWNSPQQKSALIFGGKVKYEARVFLKDDKGEQLYAQMEEEHVCLADGSTMSLEDWHCFNDGLPQGGPEPLRYKSGKNAGELKTKRVKVNDPSKPKSRMEDFLYPFPGYTVPEKRWEGATAGVYSTSADVIEELGNRDIPFLQVLGRVTALNKDLGTYYITDDPKKPGEQKGMLTLVQDDGIIHHMLNHTSTVTGRFSSSNPNLQNLPKGGKSDVKSVFVSRFGAEGKVIQSDFTSLEVYVQAVLTGDRQLIADLISGVDMHCMRAAVTFSVDYDYVVSAVADEEHPEHKLWKKRRQNAKVFSFQLAYGAGVAKIAASLKLPEDEVQAMMDAENLRYPGIAKFYVGLTAAIKAGSVATGKFFQHPSVPGLMCNPRKGSYRTPDNKLYTFRESDSPDYIARRPASKGGSATSFSPTEIKNYPVQGEGGEWAKAAMWLAIRAYYARGNFGGLALLVNQVHDALYTDAHASVALEAAALLHACMEEASTFMDWYFDWAIPVGVPSETTWGASMLEEGKMPEGFSAKVAEFRTDIRSTYINNHTPRFESKALPLAA